MAKDGTFLNRLLIALFASGVVALGAHELHLRYGGARASAAYKRGIVQELHGDLPVERGRFGSPIKVENSKNTSDNLDRGDRKKLQDLIDSVAQ